MSAAHVPTHRTKPAPTDCTEPVEPIASPLSPLEEELAAELRWYFSQAESSYGLSSNYESFVDIALSGRVGRQLKSADVSVDDRMDAAIAAGTIRRRLLAIPRREAGILQCAFGPRDWPLEIEKGLGPLLGVVVRLAVAGKRNRLPEGNITRLESVVATSLQNTFRDDPSRLKRLRGQAASLLVGALRAYADVRGRGQPVRGA